MNTYTIHLSLGNRNNQMSAVNIVGNSPKVALTRYLNAVESLKGKFKFVTLPTNYIALVIDETNGKQHTYYLASK